MIFKILTATEFQFTETRQFEENYIPYLNTTEYAPAIFQKLIAPKSHLRVTAVDKSVFGCEILTTRKEAVLDWRLDSKYKINKIDLPAEFVRKVSALQEIMGLRYGAMDFIIDEKDEVYFLENNPGGQFLFAEIHAGLSISEAIAKSLMAQ